VPTGIQQLLRLASVDDGFRRELLEKRDAIAKAADVTLSATEQAILRSVPEAQLAAMITGLPAPPADRRSFLQQMAAAAVVVLLGSATLGSSCPTSTKPTAKPDTPRRTDERHMTTAGGAAPDRPPPRPTTREMETEGGAAPDEPPPREEHRMPAPGGAAPDIPRPRPPGRPDGGPSRGIRPDLPKPKPKSPPED
jgi:hypothetical protein